MKKVQNILLLAFAIFFSLGATAKNSTEYDICVYGESASGVAAAVQAARMGKSVVLISKNDHVGGLATSGLTATDINRQDVVGGVAQEFYHLIWNYYLNPAVWRNQTRDEFLVSTLKRTYRGRNEAREMQWVYESGVAEKLMLEMLEKAGVEVLFNTRLDLKKGVVKQNGVISKIRCEGGKNIDAKVFIDCSYEGDLMAAAGVSHRVGREANSQYGETLNGVRINYTQGQDLSTISPYLNRKSGALLPLVDAKPWAVQGEADNRTQAYCYRVTLTNDPENMVPIQKPAGYNPKWHELLLRVIEQDPSMELKELITFTPMPNRKTDTNHLDFFGASFDYPTASYKERARIEELHKTYALGMMWFLGNDERVPEHLRVEMKRWGLPKDEFRGSSNFPHQIYVREARRMVGEQVMTEQNIRKEHRVDADHVVGMGSYALDCHYVSRVVDTDGKLRNEGTIFMPTTPYSISYYALTPKRSECINLLVPVCLSASHVAYSSIRMEPVYMVLGQSAATAAAMAIDKGCAVQDVNYQALKARLESDGQILSTPKK